MKYNIFILILFALMGACKSQVTTQYINKKNGHIMEKLNKEALINARDIDNGDKLIKVDTSFNPLYNRVVSGSYIEVNKKTDEATYISWGDTYGRKKILKVGDSIIKCFDFYGTGNLKTRYNKYVAKIYKNQKGEIISSGGYNFSIGTVYQYDEKGNIEKIFEDEFTFTIDNLINLLESEYVESAKTITIRKINDIENQKFIWEVIYADPLKDYPQVLHIDGKKGTILKQEDHIVVEN